MHSSRMRTDRGSGPLGVGEVYTPWLYTTPHSIPHTTPARVHVVDRMNDTRLWKHYLHRYAVGNYGSTWSDIPLSS